MITEQDKERVRQATDIIQLVGETVELRQRGRDFWGCCPFHHEKSPSFHVNPATGLWKCFGCGKGGDVFAYVMERESLSFPDAIRYLADRAGIELTEERGTSRGPKKNRLIEALDEAQSFYSTMLLRGRGEGPASGRSYLSKRGFGSDICKRWNLGYAPGHGSLVRHLTEQGFSRQEILAADLGVDSRGSLRDRFYERVMFPIHDERGRTIAFGGRVLGDAKPKYLNTKDTSVFSKGRHLFAFDRARDKMVATGDAIVCEGYTDVISMHEAGFSNAVAALGTALTLDHVRMIERFAKRRIICLFDGDAAGQRAAERAVRYVGQTKLELLCVVLPNGQDPNEYLASHTADDMRQRLDEARPLMDFVFEKRLDGYDLSVPGQRVAALDAMASLLAPLKDSILLDGYATQLADLLGVDVEQVKRAVHAKPVRELDEQRAYPAVAGRQDTPVQDSQVRYDSDSGAQITLESLSRDERMQVVAERELLATMASSPDALRARSDRIATFTWADPRHETMAWAMLATPEGTSPSEVVAAAEEVVPGASSILAGGSLGVTSEMNEQQRIDFLLDVVELWSKRREVRSIKARLKSASGNAEESQKLFVRATELQRRIGELMNELARIT